MAGLIGKPPSTRFYGQVQLPPSRAGPLRPTIAVSLKEKLPSPDQRHGTDRTAERRSANATYMAQEN